MSSFLNVRDLHAYYGSSYIIQGLSLEMAAGEAVALLGRNGMGKTTVMRSIMGFLAPARGEITLSGQTISGLSPDKIARHRIAIVPQGRRIFGSLSVEETLTIAYRKPAPQSNRPAWSIERIYETFPRLKERRTQRSNSLSGGEQQMLVTGRALVSNPDLILLDEPTEGLSPLVTKELQRVLRILRDEGIALLLAEQRISFALGVAERVYLMEKGKIAFETDAARLQQDQDLRHRYLGV